MKTTRLLPGVLLLSLPAAAAKSSPQVTQARMSIENLNKAVSAYNSQTGNWPESLSALTDGKAGSLPADALVDPWGRPFQYDPQTKHPTTGQPLIWSDGPNPGEPSSKIANWVVKE